MPDYLPSTDLGLLAWGDNFASLITANPGTYGLVAGDATAIQDAFDSYETALQTALDPGTRTPVDFNGDGVVNVFDLGILAANWNSAQPISEAFEEVDLALPSEALPGVGGSEAPAIPPSPPAR